MATTPPRPARKPLPFGLESFRTAAKRNPLLAVGMPLILFMFGGTFALQQFHEVRFKVRDRQTLVTAEMESNLKKSQRPFNLQEEYFRMQSRLEDELESYTNKPVPRPPGVA